MCIKTVVVTCEAVKLIHDASYSIETPLPAVYYVVLEWLHFVGLFTG